MNREGLGKISSVGGEFVLGGGEGKKVTADCATEFSPLLLSPLSQVVHLTPRRRRKRKEREEGGRKFFAGKGRWVGTWRRNSPNRTVAFLAN